ncbi:MULTISPECIES: alpha/beta fold hydrolase [Rhodopseudomonas]|uniref:Poly-beta-hydroxybutyrate polymerase n=2 Tax=Nitrobacteraceae TaxID=41294 RepID=A0A0D7EER2_RHOPL|nr:MULTISPECIES: alpha/beta fold hydrolase [Rhodopseudomonas]KIZ39284.1 poly-beta-hydroxybutyrate polymerase [Rhodopseudomonas palustris]MDF3813850.1 alpha/beta fold hydrolase [Rhodopseudomonas sp. BAL398]WOK20717.1 alpha/beta fold hydrolase [Rhodopseudomonas sp. BAL398]
MVNPAASRSPSIRPQDDPASIEPVGPDDSDRALHAMLAPLTGGLSPTALTLAYADWMAHLISAPARSLDIAQEALRGAAQLAEAAVHPASAWSAIAPQRGDRRFDAQDWSLQPFNLLAQGFLLTQQCWHDATTGVRGVSRQNEKIVEFSGRQLLDIFAPSNFALTNPEVIRKTVTTGGANFVQGIRNWWSDYQQALTKGKARPSGDFVVGKTVAVTPGKVVFRNELIELIQYAPATGQVYPEPILIVPAWIMKYYILDLSPHNSMVKFLTENGFTVFMISWRNPVAKDRNISLEDYRTLGIQAALASVARIVPGSRVHAVGYCLGGTLLSIAAAAMSRDGDDSLRSITLLAAQTDFTEAGELTLFINESQVAFLEDMMWKRGVLDTTQMAGAFQILRSNDLIWSRIVRDYLMGERAAPSDLMAWNADATRMPYRMHSEYLRKLFLNDDLAEGHYLVDGKPIALSDIHTPLFVVGTERDHVAPWRSTHKIHLLADAEITYVLTGGGHNAGIVAPPGERARGFQVLTKRADGPYIGPDDWLKRAAHAEGSWWSEWVGWLAARSGEQRDPPPMGGPGTNPDELPDAPGSYVLQS